MTGHSTLHGGLLRHAIATVAVLALGASLGAETLRGYIWDLTGDSLVVEERAVQLSPATRIERPNHPGIRASDLRIGWEVQVEGTAGRGGVLSARHLKVLTERYAPVTIDGFVERIDSTFFVVDGQALAWPKGLLPGDIEPGMEISAEGTLQDDGSVTIRRWNLKPRTRDGGEQKFLDEAADELSTLRSQLRTLSERSLQDYVTAVGQRIAPDYLDVREIGLRFYIVDDPEPNAFALPDGTVVVHTGLLEFLENEAQLAAVLGHEIAHVTHKHAYRNHKAAHRLKAAGIVATVAGAVLLRGEGRFARLLTSLGAKLAVTAAVNGYGRDREDEADRVGLRYAYEAGYDPFQSVEVWRLLSKRVRDRRAVSNWLFGDHSTQRARISNLTREINLRYRGRSPGASYVRNEKEYRLALRRHQAMVLFANQDYAGAERALRGILEQHPGDAAAHLYLGSVYRALEPTLRSDRAVAEYRRARELDPSLATAERELGAYFFLLGDYARAAPHLEAYLKKAPDAPDAPEARERLLSSRALSSETKPGLGVALEPSLAQAVAALGQSDARARQEAIQAIRRAGSGAASAVPALVRALDQADPAARADIVSALAFLGPAAKPAVPKLIELVQGSDRSLREPAIHALGSVGPAASAAVPALASALGDHVLRTQAIVALGKIGPAARPATSALVGVLQAASPSDRISAAIALGTIGADSTTAPAVASALGLALKDPSTSLRQQAAQALGKLGPAGRAGVPHLVEALRGDNPFVHAYAAIALGEMGRAALAALPALRERLADVDPDTRSAAAAAIRQIEGR